MPSFARAAAALALVAAAATIDRSSAFIIATQSPAASLSAAFRNHVVGVLHMSTSTSGIALPPPSGALPLALKKPSKTLTVCLEYDGSADGASSSSDLATLSMQLRKVKAGAIFTADIGALKEFATEQESARGDFPGPCPVVYCGDVEGTADAVSAGASAVILSAESADKAADVQGADIIWEVNTVADVEAVLAVQEAADSFLVGGDGIEAVIAALPRKTSCAIGSVQAMQEDDAEIAEGRHLKKAGCASIFIRKAIVGDAEDLEYAQFAVGGLTSKASSEFNFSGLTGSANGHFGGVASSGKGNKWKRNMSLSMVANSVFGNALEEIEETEEKEEVEKPSGDTIAATEEAAKEGGSEEEEKKEEPEILVSAEQDIEQENQEESKEDTIPEPELVGALNNVESQVEGESEAQVEPETEQNSEPELVEAMQEKVPESKPEPEKAPESAEPEPEPKVASNLSDAAKYFLSSSGLRKNIPDAEAKSAASIVKEREDAARRELESRIERLGIGADEEGEDA